MWEPQILHSCCVILSPYQYFRIIHRLILLPNKRTWCRKWKHYAPSNVCTQTTRRQKPECESSPLWLFTHKLWWSLKWTYCRISGTKNSLRQNLLFLSPLCVNVRPIRYPTGIEKLNHACLMWRQSKEQHQNIQMLVRNRPYTIFVK